MIGVEKKVRAARKDSPGAAKNGARFEFRLPQSLLDAAATAAATAGVDLASWVRSAMQEKLR